MTYDAFLAQGLDSIFDPNPPTAHHIGQHHVGHEAISDDNDLAWMRHASLRVLLEMSHDLIFTAWLLDPMSKDRNPSC